LVQFKSWQMGKQVEWTAVRDLAGREKAIDDHLDSCGTLTWGPIHFRRPATDREPWALPRGLRPGSHSQEHRAALAFAAHEYEKLLDANDPECNEEAQQRLLHKVATVRALMEK
jgi:hypothetical protein